MAAGAPTIEALFRRPGRTWTTGERASVIEWLSESPQLRLILASIGRRMLHAGAAEAEDVWQKYFAKGRVDYVIGMYDPARGCLFMPFLLSCLDHFAAAEGKAIERHREVPFPTVTREDGQTVEIDLPAHAMDAEHRHIQDEEIAALYRCIGLLDRKYRQVVQLSLDPASSDATVAAAMEITEQNVRVRRFRALRKLKDCLEGHGYRR
jgi:DNA-directed RNA polymerase specialized sigma24 family protein